MFLFVLRYGQFTGPFNGPPQKNSGLFTGPFNGPSPGPIKDSFKGPFLVWIMWNLFIETCWEAVGAALFFVHHFQLQANATSCVYADSFSMWRHFSSSASRALSDYIVLEASLRLC